jgi:hypothetical protein
MHVEPPHIRNVLVSRNIASGRILIGTLEAQRNIFSATEARSCFCSTRRAMSGVFENCRVNG